MNAAARNLRAPVQRLEGVKRALFLEGS